jgi:pyruvate/2-oxoglutarate dehydrogenase complex dihydrolipoamide dehydrogenase (E3) component
VAEDRRADVVVIGMGPGGEKVAGALAEEGLDVLGLDRALVGGECPYWGCVPSKMMIRAANLLAEGRRIPGMAGDASVLAAWAPVAKRVRSEATHGWDDRAAVERFEGKGGRFLRGAGRLGGPSTVLVGDRRIEATKAIVVATGTTPVIPPVDGLAGTPFWTNHEAIETDDVPASLAVLGGGAIGVELAQVFARFGSAVTVIEGADRLLSSDEPEAGAILADVFTEEGMTVHTGVAAQAVEHDGDKFTITLEGGDTVVAERLLVATGRRAELASLALDTAGIDGSGPWITVDDRCRAADRVWALGDITGKGAFTHLALHQAHAVVDDIAGRPTPAIDYRAVPRVTFCDPEVASVGLTAAAAIEQGLHIGIGSAKTPATARGWMHDVGNEGFIKLVVDNDRDVLVGATVMGPTGGEVLSMLVLAIHAEIPIGQLRSMIYAYPTFHRGVEDALRDLVEGHT